MNADGVQECGLSHFRGDDALCSEQRKVPSNAHFVHGRPLRGRFPGLSLVEFGMGCFWGAERHFWLQSGVFTTAVGYAGGYKPYPHYEEVCAGVTGHAEVVRVVYDPVSVSFEELLKLFWENHDPTQGMGQGNDIGEQYRSVIYCHTLPQYGLAMAGRQRYQQCLLRAGKGPITTEIRYPAKVFYYAEEYHQQYLAKNPEGYCRSVGAGVEYPVACNTSATG